MPEKKTPVIFADVTSQSGLDAFTHVQGNAEKTLITDIMGSGVAVADYDNDGDDDVYFVNAQPDVTNHSLKYRNRLFENRDGRFVDVTEQAGVGDWGYGMCAAFADINNDGWLDLYVGNFGANTLYLSNQDGTFTDVTGLYGVGDAGYAASISFGDVNRDGWVDLFVGNYLQYDPVKSKDMRSNYHGVAVSAGPKAFSGQNDWLYLNHEGQAFYDASQSAGVNISLGRAMGSAFFDLENDGWLDLYVANDTTFNHVLRNAGLSNGESQPQARTPKIVVFDDYSYLSAGAVLESGRAAGSMGVAVGDYNNDGQTDLLVTSYEKEPTVLYQNMGNGIFLDVSNQAGLYEPSYELISWGGQFADFDADGRLDLIIANGHTWPQVEDSHRQKSYHHIPSVFYNQDGRYLNMTDQAFLTPLPVKSGRGLALLDYDGDGDPDVIINCIDNTPQLLENRSPQGHWLQVKLDAPSAYTYGTRITAEKGDQQWNRYIDGGSGYLSQNSSWAHFGFGEIDAIDRLTIYWPHRMPQVIDNPPLNQKLIVQPE